MKECLEELFGVDVDAEDGMVADGGDCGAKGCCDGTLMGLESYFIPAKTKKQKNSANGLAFLDM